MCGIVGIFGKNNASQRARASLEKIVHRGSNVYELKDFVGGTLGANRLPIVDREFGQQPLPNEDGGIFVVQNGEVFNYKELQAELKQKGHNFKTDCDTEVLVHLYEEYREKMMDKIDSEMFAFVIYDTKTNSVFAARDALGVKPLYYATDKTGQFYFASEIKQLSCFDDIKNIRVFPPGHYYENGKFKQYLSLKIGNNIKNEKRATRELEVRLVDAVKKRVKTDLPIGVLLSGGVDSSLIMEIASRLHPDVTGIILGYPGSSDHEFALRLCKERGYKYHIVRPDIDYKQELDLLIYHLETYEPLIIRQSFALDICAREAQRLGLRIVLVGEGSDELFGGYNEFSNLPDKLINKGCEMLVKSLHAGHLQRVDRMSMKHTVEVRCPFFDKDVVKLALQIHGDLKVRRQNHQIITKYIVRKVAENFLPSYIAWRYKVPFSNGAGMNVGSNFKVQDGDVAKVVLQKAEVNIETEVVKKYGVNTKEGRYYLKKYFEYGFDKVVGSERRLIVKDNLGDLYKAKRTRLVMAEFDRLAIYFPVYFAAQEGYFKTHDLEVDFIATGGDDRTYASLVNNSAHIGLADPMFAMFENIGGVKGEIIGELVNIVPNVAVTINPSIQINEIKDFTKYRVGTFQKFTTTHSVAKYFLPSQTEIIPYDYDELVGKLIDRKIDVAIVIPEQAVELVASGGRIVFDFKILGKNFLFSGFTISNLIELKYRKKLKSFISAIRESTRYIIKNKEISFKTFQKLFPYLKNPRVIFDYYLDIWSPTIKVENSDYHAAQKMWKQVCPELLKEYLPYFGTKSITEPVLEKINDRNFRRDFPFLEDRLEELIINSMSNGAVLKFIGFWGAGKKNRITTLDKEIIDRLKKYFDGIRKVLGANIEITFILADEHAKNNGFVPREYNSYLSGIKEYLEKNDFKTMHLNILWKKWGLNQSCIIKLLEKKSERWWRDVPIAEKLENQAVKRFLFKNKKEGAQKYYIMRMLEKSHMEKSFKDSVFFVFSDGAMQTIYPKIATLYLNTRKRGFGEAPWFEN